MIDKTTCSPVSYIVSPAKVQRQWHGPLAIHVTHGTLRDRNMAEETTLSWTLLCGSKTIFPIISGNLMHYGLFGPNDIDGFLDNKIF